jgi:hypothetical protein
MAGRRERAQGDRHQGFCRGIDWIDSYDAPCTSGVAPELTRILQYLDNVLILVIALNPYIDEGRRSLCSLPLARNRESR